MPKRFTPEEDIDRMAERIQNESGVQVQDRSSFDVGFADITDLKSKQLTTRQLDFRDSVFERYRAINPEVSKDRLFEEAKGKDLKRDRQQTAKRVVTSKKEFIKLGARQVDFAGFDIKESKINRANVRTGRDFIIPATSKEKIVFAKQVSVRIKGKDVIKFRDRLGRFVKKT